MTDEAVRVQEKHDAVLFSMFLCALGLGAKLSRRVFAPLASHGCCSCFCSPVLDRSSFWTVGTHVGIMNIGIYLGRGEARVGAGGIDFLRVAFELFDGRPP